MDAGGAHLGKGDLLAGHVPAWPMIAPTGLVVKPLDIGPSPAGCTMAGESRP
jgi:hypothetical protein